MKKIILPLTIITLVAALITINVDKDNFEINPDKNYGSKKIRNNVYSEHKSKVKGRGFDSPDKYAELFRKIHLKEGEDFEPNFLIKEFEQAKRKRSKYAVTTTRLDWVERGPANVGGRTRGLIVDPDDPSKNTWFAGSVSGGIWKTTNAGVSWRNLTDDLPALSTTVLAMAESNHNIIYAGTGEGFYNIGGIVGQGIFKSIDKGESWQQLPSTASPEFRYVNRIVVNPDNSDILLAATNTGIYKSIDGGTSWIKKFGNGSRCQHLIANPQNFNSLYCAVNGYGVIKSTDAGETWNLPYNFSEYYLRYEIAIAPTDTARLYASVEYPDNGSRLLMSTDAGVTWQNVPENQNSHFVGADWLNQQGWYDNTIAVHPYNENIVFFGGIDLWKAEITPGNPPERFSQPITDGYGQYGVNANIHVDQHNIVMIPVNAATGEFRILNGNDGGVAYSNDGGVTWQETDNSGYNTTQFYGVDKRNGYRQYLGGTQDNGTYISSVEETVDTTSYVYILGGDGFEVAWHYTDPYKMIGGSQFNTLYRTETAWSTDEPANNGFDDWGNSDNSPFLSVVTKSNSDPDLIFTISRSGVWRSDNFAKDWTLTSIPPEQLGSNHYFSIPQVEISIADPQVVWAGAYMGSEGNVLLSKDGGLSFEPTNNLKNIGRISGLFTHPTDTGTAFVCFGYFGEQKIIKTTDYGESWSDITGFENGATSSNGFPDVAVYSGILMPYNTDIIWAGTEIGIFESVDGGGTWYYADNGLPAVAVWDMKIVNDEIVVGTHGRGIWSVSLPELQGYEPPEAILAPRINTIFVHTSGIKANFSLRSLYDSTHVLVGEEIVNRLGENQIDDFDIPLTSGLEGEVPVQIISYKGNRTYKSSVKYFLNTPLLPSKTTYVNSFEDETNEDFILDSLYFASAQGFASGALHSAHPYENGVQATALLRVPIIVADNNATMTYRDIAIIEPGEDGIEYGSADFYDYVVVEGFDGKNWVPLQDGYDARYNTTWQNAYNGNLIGDESMYVNHSINLLDTFSPGDTILVRFRLFADAYVNSWGWAIDYIDIQSGVTGIDDNKSIPTNYTLKQNYPNPFNPTTSIEYQVVNNENVTLKVYDILGREVKTLVNKVHSPGNYEITFDANELSSGVYIYRLRAGQFEQTRKMVILK